MSVSYLNCGGIQYPIDDELLYRQEVEFLRNDPKGGVPDKWRPIWERSFGPGDTVLDIGAYIGVLSINFALRGANVIAYEGSSNNYPRLKEIVKRLPQIKVLPVALSDVDKRCKTQFNDCLGTHHPSQLIEYQRYDDHQPACQMDVAFVKMDIEGMETVALKAMHTLLRQNGYRRPIFQIEYHPDMPHKYDNYPGFVKPEDGGFDLEREFLFNWNFSVFDEDLKPTTLRDHGQYFFIPQERIHTIVK